MNRLFVGNLPWSMRSADLRRVFEKFGRVEDAIVMMHPGRDRSRGYGFVEFAHFQMAAAAIAEMHGGEIMGRKLTVALAKDRPLPGEWNPQAER